MIVGSGLVARAFSASFQQRDDVCIYAAGVSNSSGVNSSEFTRERVRLREALETARGVCAFVYFGTCSVGDSEMQNTPYVQHKLSMEQLVMQHAHPLVLRLPQVAGHTPNPHTLLNFLYARIVRSETFSVWHSAHRNIIDVEDVATLATRWINDKTIRNRILNLANPRSYALLDIVHAMEQVVGKTAIYDLQPRGYHYEIDVTPMLSILNRAHIQFDQHYLNRILNKYYAQN